MGLDKNYGGYKKMTDNGMRLIDNARKAYENSSRVNDKWAMNYWQCVINSLLRKYGH